VSIQVDSPTTVITVQGFGEAEQGKKNQLLNQLEGVEGVETVEVTVNPKP
jgi:translation elongation factor EF-1beta